MRTLASVAVTLAVALAVPVALRAQQAVPAQAAPAPIPDLAPLSPGARIEDERNTISVSRLAAASAVFVTQNQVVVDYFAGRALEVPAGSGSGFIWDAKGHVVTNFHVVQDAKSVTVTLHDQRSFPAQVVGVEPHRDIAVLRIDTGGEPLTPLRRADRKATLEVGQKVIAIGNPFGLDHTVTTGIVSAVGREVQGESGVAMRDMIQTDAAINPGNSGGPLLDSGGRLIGMNSAIYSRSGAWAGIGFAVPISVIERVVPQLIQRGRVRQVGLGVQLDPQGSIERRLGMAGVVVWSVTPGTPAAKAGLKGLQRSRRGLSLGDVIVGINGNQLETYDDLYAALDGLDPGTRVKLKILRGEKLLDKELPVVALE